MLEYDNKAYESGVKEKVIDMAINGSGIRDISRVLNISKTTVIRWIKKSGQVGSS
jgi:transposase-like protein